MKLNLKIIIICFVILTIGFFIYKKIGNKKNGNKSFICNKISEKQALEIVRVLPEVKNFLKLNFPEGNKPFVNIDHKTKSGSFVVHVYEVVKDSPSSDTVHSATFNWYTLDSCTGKIKCSFIIYENGKRIRASDQSENSCI